MRLHADDTILAVGHTGSDDPDGKTDQAIVLNPSGWSPAIDLQFRHVARLGGFPPPAAPVALRHRPSVRGHRNRLAGEVLGHACVLGTSQC